MRAKFLGLLAVLVLLTGCAGSPVAESDGVRVAATTYPVFLLAQEVTRDVPDVSVTLVIDQQVSCLHDYTLTMRDMTEIERTDVILENGAGLEDFLDDALAGRPVVDCSQGIVLRTEENGEVDPHIWMDPRNAAAMARNIADGLAQADPDHAARYQKNAEEIADELDDFRDEMLELLGDGDYALITFHDGFGYFAESFGLELAAAVEEEEGAEASAKTLAHICDLVREREIPAVFTEVNGSDASAQTISRECGCEVFSLDMVMSGEGGGLAAYEAVIRQNIETILEAFT